MEDFSHFFKAWLNLNLALHHMSLFDCGFDGFIYVIHFSMAILESVVANIDESEDGGKEREDSGYVRGG